MCSMIGTLPTGTSGFGRWAVSGLRRVPKPPAMTTAFISGSPKSQTGTPKPHRAYRSIAERVARRNLPEALIAFRAPLSRPQDQKQRHSGQEASEMGKPRDLSSFRPGRPGDQAAQELDQEPEPQDEERGDADQADEEAHDDEGEDVGSRKKQQIGAEHPGHRPARSDHGDGRVRIERHLRERGDKARRQIEDQKSTVTQGVLDVVAEDPQVEHVAADVQEAPVQEHRRENGEDRRKDRCPGLARSGEPAGHEPELQDEIMRGPGPFRRRRSLERQLVEEQENVHGDQCDRNEGSSEARYIVFQGKHLGPRTASYWGVMSSMAANNWPPSCVIHGGA